jgi:hypothetical protein
MCVKNGCGDPECSTSSGYADELTFGKNEEDPDVFNGYWDSPCYVCARAFEEANPDWVPKYGRCWPEVP